MRKPLDFYNIANHHRRKEERTSASASGSTTFAVTAANITERLVRGRQLSPLSSCFFRLVVPEQKAISLLAFELRFTARQQREQGGRRVARMLCPS